MSVQKQIYEQVFQCDAPAFLARLVLHALRLPVLVSFAGAGLRDLESRQAPAVVLGMERSDSVTRGQLQMALVIRRLRTP